jgi:hypothetical protein
LVLNAGDLVLYKVAERWRRIAIEELLELFCRLPVT